MDASLAKPKSCVAGLSAVSKSHANTNDRRLSEIENVGLASGQHSTYDYTTIR